MRVNSSRANDEDANAYRTVGYRMSSGRRRRFITSPAGSGEAMVAVWIGELEVADCPLG
jgi:hypothetical protein